MDIFPSSEFVTRVIVVFTTVVLCIGVGTGACITHIVWRFLQ